MPDCVMRAGVFGALVGGLMSGIVSADVVVVDQPTTADDGSVGLGWYSHSEPRVRKNYKHADDFVLGAAAELTRVVWWGQSSYHSHPDLRNFDSFTVEFFEVVDVDGETLPGAVLASEVFPIGATAPVATGRETPAGALEHRHEAAFTSPVALGAGRYFIAISAGMIETDFQSDAWQWQDADLHNGWSASYSWAGDAWTGFQDTDSAFVLYAVPTVPGTAAFGCAGLLAGFRRRG